jgi:HD superfamily phosphohydrolase
LGTCNYIFPNAVHTRFEHSIGTYYIAKKLMETICANTNPIDICDYLSHIPELEHHYGTEYILKPPEQTYILDEYVVELICIAALCHDLGHGPYSHLFDDAFLPAVGKLNMPYSSHEERSELLIESIITSDIVLKNIVSQSDINFIKTLINPKKIHKGFIYQIVSNDPDVDKFDYLPRDIKTINFQGKVDINRLINMVKIIDNNIVYSKQALPDIYNLYYTRHQLHRQIYCHKGVISVQYIIVEILCLLDSIIKMSDMISNPNEFCDLTDDFIFEVPKILKKFANLSEDHKNKLEKINKLIDKLNNHDLYVYVGSSITENKVDLTNLINKFHDDMDNIIIYESKIGYVSGNKPNPLDNILVYDSKDMNKILSKIEVIKQRRTDITLIMPNLYQEHLTIIFYKNKNDIDKINDIREMFLHK